MHVLLIGVHPGLFLLSIPKCSNNFGTLGSRVQLYCEASVTLCEQSDRDAGGTIQSAAYIRLTMKLFSHASRETRRLCLLYR